MWFASRLKLKFSNYVYVYNNIPFIMEERRNLLYSSGVLFENLGIVEMNSDVIC